MSVKPGIKPGPKSQDDWNALFFEATQLFTPSTPIDENDLFAGRGLQIRKMMEGIPVRKHATIKLTHYQFV